MWTLDQLETFKSVAITNSFSKAARLRKISTAAVGKQIKTLEEALGAQLFYRTTRQVKLTEMGSAFLQHCHAILNEVEKTHEFLATQRKEVQGKIKIVSSIVFGETYIVPFLHELLEQHPKLIIDLELSDRIPNIEAEAIDLVVGLMAGLPAHYTSRRIKDVRYAICASPHYLKKFGTPNIPEDLALHHFITHSQRSDPLSITFTDHKKIHLKPRIFTNSTHAMRQCCIDNLGIGMFHLDAVMNDLQQHRLIEILQPYTEPAKPLYLYFKTVQYIEPKLRSVIDFLLAKINIE